MPKLAIYIPKDDMKKIDRWRKKLNFSRIFMQALAKEIQRQSKSLPATKKLAKAAAHYGQQLSEDLAPIRELGLALGTADVVDCRLTADEIQAILNVGSADAKSADQTVKQVMKRHKKAIGKSKGSTDDAKLPGWRASLYEGYYEGVQSAWDEVCRIMNGAAAETDERTRK